jgi:hypothetical protein
MAAVMVIRLDEGCAGVTKNVDLDGSDMRVQEAYYHPKAFRVTRAADGLASPPQNIWQEGSQQKNSAPGRPLTFALGALAGFLFCCVAAILRLRVFEWGVEVAYPVAKWLSER